MTGDELRGAREAASLSRQELAHKSGVTRETIRRLEEGGSTYASTWKKLRTALGYLPQVEPEAPEADDLAHLIRCFQRADTEGRRALIRFGAFVASGGFGQAHDAATA